MRILITTGLNLVLFAWAFAQQFTNITESAGVTDIHRANPIDQQCVFDVTFVMNSGCAFGDYNNDGFPDLYLANGGDFSNTLYRNNGNGTFTDVTQTAGVGDLSRSMGVGFGDVDNDGWLDLYITNFGQPNRLYLNNQNGTFTDISAQAGVGHSGFNTSFVFDDFNKDGWLDIYVVTYGEICDLVPEDDSLAGSPNVLYLNNQDGTFTDMTVAAEAGGGTRWSLAVTSVDIDNDGDQDIYVANDFKGGSTLLINELAEMGVLRFTDRSEQYNVQILGNMMSAIFGDIDNDGDLDFYSTNIREDPPQDPGRFNGNALFRNEYPTPVFTDISFESGANMGHWGWGSLFIDVDFDGWLDILEVNGWPLNTGGTNFAFRSNLLFRNLDGTHFEEIGQSLGLDRPETTSGIILLDSRGLAKADIDNDGDEDVYIRNNRESGVLLRNDYSGPNHWLQLEARGTTSNRFAIGTRFRLTAGSITRTDYVTGGNSYLSQSSPIVTFGLGQATSVDSLVVLWPAGGRDVFFNLQADRRYRIVEGEGNVTSVRTPSGERAPRGSQDLIFDIQTTPEGIRISFGGSAGSFLEISVFNLLGQKISQIFKGTISTPQQEIIWNGRNNHGRQIGSGVYFIRMLSDANVRTKKVVMIR